MTKDQRYPTCKRGLQVRDGTKRIARVRWRFWTRVMLASADLELFARMRRIRAKKDAGYDV